MTDPFVVDSSIAIGWVHPDQSTDLSVRLLVDVKQGAKLHVPSLWFIEMANVLAVLVRRKKLTEADCSTALARLERLNLQVDHESTVIAFTRLYTLAEQHGLTVYDAVYLELAIRKSLPLATKDAQLQFAARKCGIKVL
ncbi:MAG TPA: type II toxin-antitoxin system VapC family toxin [Verrucomicrobiae bacterium]